MSQRTGPANRLTETGLMKAPYGVYPRTEYVAEQSRAVFALLIWFLLSAICALSLLETVPDGAITWHILLVAAAIGMATIVLQLVPNRSYARELICFLALMAALVLPAALYLGALSENYLFLHLCALLLLAVPALLRLWPWQFQLAASATACLSAVFITFPLGALAIFQSLALLSLISILGVLSLWVQKSGSTQTVLALENRAEKVWQKSIFGYQAQRLKNTLLCEAGILIVLAFLDLSLGFSKFSTPLAAKFYGGFAIIAAIFFASIKRQRSEFVLLISSCAVAAAISYSRAGYDPADNPYAVLPIIYLGLLIAVFPTTLLWQTITIWALLLTDASIRLLDYKTGSFFENVLSILSSHRSEFFVLFCGFAACAVVSYLMRRDRLERSSKFANYLLAENKDEETAERVAVSHRAVDLLHAERVRGLFSGLFVIGLVSCTAASLIIIDQHAAHTILIPASWAGFLLLWAFLVYQVRRLPQLWQASGLVILALLLWPTLLLIGAKEPGVYWLFLPLALTLSLGLVPWTGRELIPLATVMIAIGFETLARLEMGALSYAVLLASMIAGVLLSLNFSRKVRERGLLEHFYGALRRLDSVENVERLLSDYATHITSSPAAIVYTLNGKSEVVRDGQAYAIPQDSARLKVLFNTSERLDNDESDVSLSLVNWLPSAFSIFDERFGVLSPRGGLLININLSKDRDELTNKSSHRRIALFVTSTMPFWRFFHAEEITLTRFLAVLARARVMEFLEQEDRTRAERGIDDYAQSREYELNTLVHDINNTVQDLTLLCDAIVEELSSSAAEGKNYLVLEQVSRIATIARSVATVVSDTKRRRELEQTEDLRPRETIEVNVVVREIVSFAKVRGERKRIIVADPELCEEAVFTKVSMREHLETILRNLLNNALSYSDPGASVKIVLRADEKFVYVDIIDSGIGLTEAECETVFLPGYRGKSVSNNRGGLGLGLAESRRVAEAAGGKISAQSDGPGKGAVFTLQLPRVSQSKNVETAADWALLVDDQIALTEFYAKIARAMQLKAETANSVPEALAIVRAKGRPGLVITDIQLGNTDGLDLVRHLRADFGNVFPIMVISGMSSEEVAHKARAAGATDYVAKPIGQRALYARIQSLLLQ